MAPHNDYPKFERPRFFAGMILSAEDLQAEQQYHDNKRRMHNRCLHGCRVACGLEVDLHKNTVYIEPGMALDCHGNEVVVSEPAEISLPPRKRRFFLTIAYSETATTPGPGFSCDHESEKLEFSRIQESFKLGWTARDPLADHNCQKGAWVTCGRSHPIAIAKFVFRRRTLRISRSFEAQISRGRQFG